MQFLKLCYCFILLLWITAVCGCNSCCNNTPLCDNPPCDTGYDNSTGNNSNLRYDTLNKYYLVSSVYGEIKQLLVCCSGIQGDFANRYYEGLVAKFGDQKVKGIIVGVQLHPNTIAQMSQRSVLNDDAPKTVSAVLKSFMGHDKLKKLKLIDSLNFTIKKLDDVYLKGKAVEEEDILLLKKFDTVIANEIRDHFTENYIKLHPSEDFQKVRKNVAVVNCYMQLSASADNPRVDFWLQDMFNVLQTDNENDSIILVYSDTIIPDYKETVDAIINQFAGSDLKLKSKATKIAFLQGGNILACGNFVLIGKDVLYNNIPLSTNRTQPVPNDIKSNLADSLKKLFNTKHIIWTGNEGHIRIPGVSPANTSTQPISVSYTHLTLPTNREV